MCVSKRSKYTKTANKNFSTNSQTDKMGLKILGAEDTIEEAHLTKNGYNYMCELTNLDSRF